MGEMMRRTTGFMVAAFALLLPLAPGCVIVPQEVEDDIRVNCAVGDGTLADWEALTDDERHEAFWKLTRSWHDMNLSINDEPVPEEYLTDPWAAEEPADEASETDVADEPSEDEGAAEEPGEPETGGDE